jgi:hypothetical protein
MKETHEAITSLASFPSSSLILTPVSQRAHVHFNIPLAKQNKAEPESHVTPISFPEVCFANLSSILSICQGLTVIKSFVNEKRTPVLMR